MEAYWDLRLGQLIDETLPHFIKKENTQERERKRDKGPLPKSRQANSRKEVGHQEKMEPLRTEPSSNCMKHIN
jgi:hypothetical protein